ncbi:MAG: NAD(P)H-hydrate dehydratase [Woeseia sp.]
MNLPVEIYSADAVRRIDRQAIEIARVPGYTLMQRAAAAALDTATTACPAARIWQVVCGAGNNGGDGYVLARLAAERGIAVSVIAITPPDTLRGDAAVAYRDFTAAGGIAQPWDGILDSQANLIVDAILGSGQDRAVAGTFADAIEAINRHPASVLALDLPSGLGADDGIIFGHAVRADLTVTFVGLKAGLFLGHGPAHSGAVYFAGLGIPDSARATVTPMLRRIGDATICDALPPRKADAHKGDFGHAVIVGGSPGMAGAVSMCGQAALRCGAGRVSVLTYPGHCAPLLAACPELMCHEMDHQETRPAELARLLGCAAAVAVGPGLGTNDWGRTIWREVLRCERPLVVDADALNLLARAPTRCNRWILTPHPGEAGRLLGTSAAAVQADRLGALAALVSRYGGTVVLKGAGTLVSSLNGVPWLCTAGNPGMATAGMGDILTGVIVALLAQGMSQEVAAIVAAGVHSRAADAAAGKVPRGMLATDLLPQLRRFVNPCE